MGFYSRVKCDGSAEVLWGGRAGEPKSTDFTGNHGQEQRYCRSSEGELIQLQESQMLTLCPTRSSPCTQTKTMCTGKQETLEPWVPSCCCKKLKSCALQGVFHCFQLHSVGIYGSPLLQVTYTLNFLACASSDTMKFLLRGFSVSSISRFLNIPLSAHVPTLTLTQPLQTGRKGDLAVR